MADPWAEAGFKEAEKVKPSGEPPKDTWTAAGFKDVTPAPAGGEREATLTAPPTPPPLSLFDVQQDAELAARQGVNPYATSKYFPAKGMSSSPLAAAAPNNAPQRLGDLEEFEWGQGYKSPTGDERFINPKTDFVARDPATNKLAVYARNAQVNENRFTSAARLMMPGLAVGPVTSSIRAVPQATETAAAALPHSSALAPAAMAARTPSGAVGTAVGAELATERAANIASDIESFDRLGVRKPPIAFSQGPVSGLGQMTSRIPYLGDPIKKSLDEALVGARDASRAISSDMAPSATVEQAGHALQSGLDRFRTAGVSDLEPGVLTDLGIQPRAPGPYVGEVAPVTPGTAPTILRPNGTTTAYNPAQHILVNDAGRIGAYENAARGAPQMSAAAEQRATAAAPIRESAFYPYGGLSQTNRGVAVPAARSLDQTIMGRRAAADLSDAELQTLVRTPAADTSFAARSEALYEKAWRSVPAFQRIDETANPNMLAAANTRAALGGIDREVANQIAGQGTITGELADRIRNSRAANFTLDDMRAIRTEVGRALSNFSPYQASLDRRQLGTLYGALSRDIEVGLQDLANRAYQRTQISNNRPDYVQPIVALRADQSLRDFRTADRYFRQGIDRMDRFAKLAGTDNPQQAAGMLIRSALDGTKGNMGMLRSAMGALRPEERNQFSALMLDQMGKPKPNARGMVEEAGFSPQTFMTSWNAMSPQARALMFGGEYTQAMNDLSRVVSRLANVEALANTSRSGTDLINYLTMAGTGILAMNHQTALLGGMLAPTAAFSVLFSRPAYVNWIAQYARLRAAMARAPVNTTAPRMAALINQLGQMARKDPALLPAYNAIAAEHGVGNRNQQDQPVEGQPRMH